MTCNLKIKVLYELLSEVSHQEWLDHVLNQVISRDSHANSSA